MLLPAPAGMALGGVELDSVATLLPAPAGLPLRLRALAGELNLIRSGVDRDAEPPRRLTPMERVTFFTCLGGWGPDQARHYLRDRLIGYLLLEGLRPGEIVRLDM
ncbi:hypothetical protein [Streptomyces sp. WG7]|uniref:hypothetical protein n=1 Tax=Streptomyces sp. WG7 TaxID=3417650 RepID=UPI003CF46157